MNVLRMQVMGIGALMVMIAAGFAAAQDDAHHDHSAHDGHNHTFEFHGSHWDEETLALASTLPVLDEGRVKPLHTVASYTLLAFNGKRVVRIEDHKLTPMEWLLDTLFFPEEARNYPIFIIDDSAVLIAAGLHLTNKDRRDRYSYNELMPARERIRELANQYGHMEPKQRTATQGDLVILGTNLSRYESLLFHGDFATYVNRIGESPELKRIFGDVEGVRLSQFLEQASAVHDVAVRLRGQDFTSDPSGDMQADANGFQILFRDLGQNTYGSQFLTMIPPLATVDEEEEWHSPSSITDQALMTGSEPKEGYLATIASFERLFDLAGEPAAFKEELKRLHERTVSMAESRGQYDKIPMEVSYYHWDFFFKAMMLCFLPAFLCVVVSWLLNREKLPYRVVNGLAVTLCVVGLGLVIAGITMRCIIRGRPPVSTLYETVLFISATGVLVALVIEWINKKKVALLVATVIGALGMLLAHKHEAVEGTDTMPQLVAVLDTNFWLATHVTTVTLGYAAGLLAGLIAHVYLLGKLIGFRRTDSKFYRDVARMVYGVICFGLLFSVVGTILGGVWANDSWGRFWGWDPKENGALLICLWELAILHGRMGGYIRDHGLCMAAVFGNIVVSFSWWGVNLLGEGLHSYGFTDAAKTALDSFYLSQGVVLGLGLVAWFIAESRSKVGTSSTA